MSQGSLFVRQMTKCFICLSCFEKSLKVLFAHNNQSYLMHSENKRRKIRTQSIVD